MKKTLLSVLAAVSVIGAASAVPSAEDRKAMCDKNPDKYVWVEKNQACVPVNPCTTSNESMKKAYCLDYVILNGDYSSGDDHGSLSHARQVIDRYVTQVLKTSVAEVKFLDKDAKRPEGIAAVKTSDGGYFAVWLATYGADMYDDAYEFRNALFAYYGHDEEVVPIVSEAECRDIADFASLLYGRLIEFRTRDDIATKDDASSSHGGAWVFHRLTQRPWNDKYEHYINYNPTTKECFYVEDWFSE